ncbi:hypothetical protein ABB37_07505 [Leptomonas pyrrhocoris]|uniref:Membrane-associated protein n=1 Tax=Leptomonas pyrrhocoris TaxID=157538 RepID=A0A0M9FV10_LEPPY|nr:hypothetical protein ABB37_07505 [Leptomonas pyrrhocoris]XP_015655090.1 hypothetical protein ABB37_07505 [Leptomonas pyrrhocoris]KPA76650.1 hypothetical protein ABB37_07505 [Leptomonas pyrrhocoris]KPA76651.1 hypothetical protein ABB37_07505 [Leptomonas pyrrhocoris]|eukprot:XP_015655089.1 hypothetical protein ABB37_07505 [Leptomonas pyrrhocoris]
MGILAHAKRRATAEVFLAALLSLLLVASLSASAAPTKESHLHCSPTETEPYGSINCVINVRDGFQEPTMSFNPAQFTVVARASNNAAVVTTSEMARGTDITTVVFSLTASTGTDLFIRVFLQDTTTAGTGTAVAEIRGSGITVSILSWPASFMGALTCNATSTGLSLRGSTLCRAPLYDNNNAASVLHSSDVIFSEANVLGSFSFVSGTRELVFLFTAPASTPVVVSTFTVKVRIRGQDIAKNPNSVQSTQLPLLYPQMMALAAYTGVRCATETRPITCSVTASDAQGPVAFNASQFCIQVERLMDGSSSSGGTPYKYWMDTTHTLALTVRRSDTRPWVGVLQWEPKVKDSIFEARLRVQTSVDGTAIAGSGSGSGSCLNSKAADVAGSPFPFVNGVLPNSQSVTLRGCRTSVIASGNTTVCFIDLANNVAGDSAYYIVSTTHRHSSVSNFTYVDNDALCQCRSLWFTYHAPTSLTARVDDCVNVTVYTDFARTPASVVTAMNVPYRLNVFPVASGPGHDTSPGSSAAAIVVVGILFYGGVLGVGTYLIVRRSRKAARIRLERVLKARNAAAEMAKRGSSGSGGNAGAGGDGAGGVDGLGGAPALSPPAGATDVTRTPAGVPAGAAQGEGALSRSSSSAVVHSAPLSASAHGRSAPDVDGTMSSRNAAPPPTAVVSNAAVMQERFHSDSD